MRPQGPWAHSSSCITNETRYNAGAEEIFTKECKEEGTRANIGLASLNLPSVQFGAVNIPSPTMGVSFSYPGSPTEGKEGTVQQGGPNYPDQFFIYSVVHGQSRPWQL